MNVETLQAAVRILFLLDQGGTPPTNGGHAEKTGAVAVIVSEKKLQALHFWMRNPDYLAYEILERVDSGAFHSDWIAKADELVKGVEPDLRRYPMLRYRFGAYEPIDESFAYLVAAGPVTCPQ